MAIWLMLLLAAVVLAVVGATTAAWWLLVLGVLLLLAGVGWAAFGRPTPDGGLARRWSTTRRGAR